MHNLLGDEYAWTVSTYCVSIRGVNRTCGVLTTLGGRHDESQGIEMTPTKVFATCEVNPSDRRSNHACKYFGAICGTPLRYSLI